MNDTASPEVRFAGRPLPGWYDDAKLGIFIHWGIYSVNGVDESWAFYNKKVPHAEYMKQLNGFTASKYDPASWAELIEKSGAKYAVITTKHDKVKSSVRQKRKRELAAGCGLEERDITWVSASKGVNLDQLREIVVAARNGRELARSRWFERWSDCEIAIAWLQRIAPELATDDVPRPRRTGARGYLLDRPPGTLAPGFEAFRHSDRRHYFHLHAPDGLTLLFSHGYGTARELDAIRRCELARQEAHRRATKKPSDEFRRG